jgi:hypothetical protein
MTQSTLNFKSEHEVPFNSFVCSKRCNLKQNIILNYQKNFLIESENYQLKF